MNFIGVIANSVGILIGGVVGVTVGNRIPDKIGETLMSALGLAVFFIGVAGVKLEGNLIIMVLSISVGAVIGELIDFDAKINNLGVGIQQWISKHASSSNEENFGEAFVSTSLLVCMGAMSLVGSMESGMLGDPSTLLTKAIIDMILIMVLSATMGSGCLFAAFPLFLYQGGLTLLSGVVAPHMSDYIILQMSYIGSILIVAVGLNMLELTKIRVGNLILAPFIPLFLMFFV